MNTETVTGGSMIRFNGENLFEMTPATPLTEINIDQFREVMKKHSFACFRGLIKPEDVKRSLKLVQQKFRPENDLPAQGVNPRLIQKNTQKISVAGGGVRNNNTARILRTFFNPLWEEDAYEMRETFRVMARLRNLMIGLPLDFATDKIEPNGLWSAARVHHYPIGGGFFAPHKDWITEDVVGRNDLEFFHCVLIMSKRGVDFQKGGGYVEVNGVRRYLEQEFEIGDIAVYDGRTLHGVEDIDPDKRLDFGHPAGRYAAFATLYKDMKSSEEMENLKKEIES